MVVPNDRISWDELQRLNPSAIIISPGPGSPEKAGDFGICGRVIREMNCPILGVCLGHQGICFEFGAKIAPAREVMHGRASAIFHQGSRIFDSVPSGFSAIRYNSLIAEELPDCLELIAWTESGEVMGVRHRSRPLWGVQFHPESICTEHGNTVLGNFLRMSCPRVATDTNTFRLDGCGAGASYTGDGEVVVEGPDAFDIIAADLMANRHQPDPACPHEFQGGWVGYVTYEGVPRFIKADRFQAFTSMPADPPPVCSAGPLLFDIPRHEYLEKVGECLELIRAGESYEICLTNQLRGLCASDPLDCYEALRSANPAPFAAYLKFPDLQIASTSPELFLHVTAEGLVTSRPIKGTAARSSDPRELAADPKTRAENLMIVDLVRNDLGRVCRPGTVQVPSLMAIESYATVHQMVSTIKGRLRPGLAALDAVRAAFPPGSMTGAPKIRTMEILRRLEQRPRGIYSGCIGYLSYTGAAKFSVAIRTAVFQNAQVTIGTGGAIVAQSDPAREWDEIVLKAQVLAQALSTSAG